MTSAEAYGNHIPEDVFSAIDLSDLVVADISHRSPNVMYELAFAHALGIPTISSICPTRSHRPSRRKTNHPLAPPAKRKIFYLSQERTLLPTKPSKQAIARN
jgi:nucleoside 2-deoxyribosyltransferase